MRKRLVFALVPLLALLVLAEVGTRLLAPPQPYAPHGPLGWTVQPGLDGLEVGPRFGQRPFYVTTNADGLRSAVPRARQPGVARVAVFGDSTIFGWGLPPEGAPPAQLAATLGPEVEAINAGQPGYSSEQSLRLARRLLPAYQPDGVVWFQTWHDIARATGPDRDLLPAEAAAPPWWSHSALLSALLRRRDTARAAPASTDPLFPFAHHNQPDGVERVDAASRSDVYRQLVALAAEHDAWLVVALIPNLELLSDRTRPSPLPEQVAADCERLGVPFVDLSPVVTGRGYDALTLPGDPGHYTAAANAELVAPVAEAIRALPAWPPR